MARNNELRAYQVTQTFIGPIPDPTAMEKYARIDPEFPKRILAMAEQQATHRQALEVKAVDSAIDAQRVGLKLAFVVALAAFGVACYLGSIGQTLTACVIGGGDLVALTSLFIYGKNRNTPQRPPPPPSR